MILLFAYFLLFLGGLVTIIITSIRIYLSSKRKNVVAFFHPYCNDGGGGERVLWCAVKAVQELSKDIHVVVYAGKEPHLDKSTILKKIRNHFNLSVDEDRIEFIFLSKRWLVEDKTWSRFTLLGQSLGSMILGWEAISLLNPRVIIDSMGYAFTYPVFKYLGGCKVACYVHYPTISTDMLKLVYERRPNFNNESEIASSFLRSRLKLIYYEFFALLYSLVGSRADVVMVNSTWTGNHINSLWKVPSKTSIVFPPCNTMELQKIKSEKREQFIISIGQFRPEKDHNLQLEAFKTFLNTYPQWNGKVKLVLIGSSRNKEDQARVEALQSRCKKENIPEVIFQVNAKFSELQNWLSKATIGVHTMWNEHFGIGVVEFMGAGVIPVAHNSGGPKEDIVVDFDGEKTGYLASSAIEYAAHFNTIFSMSEAERLKIQANARKSAIRFSDEQFSTRFKKSISLVINVQ